MTEKIKEMPAAGRPYEKAGRLGEDVLTDAELLAVLLRSGVRGTNSIELAQEVLKRAGGSLAGLYDLSREELMRIPGIGRVKSLEIRCVLVLSKRISMSRRAERTDFSAPALVADYFMEELRHEKAEQLRVLYLDKKSRLLRASVLTHGSSDAAMVPVREIVGEALRLGASSLILVHNHPSGDPAPSAADVEATSRVRRAAELVDLSLLDHVVIGDGRYVSMLEKGLIK